MSKPTPPHHAIILIERSAVKDGYNVTLDLGANGLWDIVAAAPLHEHSPPPDDEIRVIVAPARVTP